ADQRLESRGPRLVAPGDPMPAEHADHAQLDHRQRNHCQVVRVQHDVDLEVLEHGRAAETDIGGQVDVRGAEPCRPFRQTPANQQRGGKRDQGAQHRRVDGPAACAHARDGDDERRQRRHDHQGYRPAERGRGVEMKTAASARSRAGGGTRRGGGEEVAGGGQQRAQRGLSWVEERPARAASARPRATTASDTIATSTAISCPTGGPDTPMITRGPFAGCTWAAARAEKRATPTNAMPAPPNISGIPARALARLRRQTAAKIPIESRLAATNSTETRPVVRLFIGFGRGRATRWSGRREPPTAALQRLRLTAHHARRAGAPAP